MKNFLRAAGGPSVVAGLGMLFALIIVWQLPHVMALRYLLIVLLAVLFAPAAFRFLRPSHGQSLLQLSPRTGLLIFALFLGWLAIVAAFISNAPEQSFRELRSEWLAAVICLVVGLGAGARTAGDGAAWEGAALRAVFWGLVAHAVLQLGYTGWVLLQHGELPYRFSGISDHRANVTYTNGLALAILLASMTANTSTQASMLRIGRRAQIAVYFLLFASTIASGTRNGAALFLVLTLVGGLVFAARFHGSDARRLWWTVAASVMVVVFGALVAFKSDPRWSRFLETVPIAWDIDGNRAWVNSKLYPMPRAADGGKLDKSAYERIAFLRVAGRLMLQHPLGTEISRDAFRDLLKREYPEVRHGHAHNGYLDLTLSAGFPGLGLWLAFLVSAGWYGVRNFRKSGNAYGLALALVVFAYAARSGLDSIIRDHIVEEFLLCTGVLIGCVHATSNAEAVHD